jgi:hypothetical protein
MLEDQLLAIGWLYVALLLLVKQLPLEGRNSGVRSTPRASAREDMRRNFCAAANFKYQRGYRSSGGENINMHDLNPAQNAIINKAEIR